jgi:polysaccharide biosynthesis transport protein
MSQQPTLVPVPEFASLGASDIWRIIRKRYLLILASFVVLGLGGTAGLVAWRFYAPQYTAEGVIEVEPGAATANPLAGGFDQSLPPYLYQQYVESQVLAIRNSRVLSAALEELKDEQTMFTGPGAGILLSRTLQVSYIPNTQNILVSLRGSNKEQVQAIVRVVLKKYTDQLKDDREQTDKDRKEGLEGEQKSLKDQVDQLSRDLARLRDEANLIVTDPRSSEQLARLTALIRQLSDTQVALAEANVAWTTFQDLRKEAEQGKDMTQALMAFPEVLESLNRDPATTAMSEQVSRMSQELQNLKGRFGPKYDQVVRAEAALQGYQADLQGKRAEVLGTLFQQQAALLKSKYDRLRGAELELLTRVDDARKEAIRAAKLSAEYLTREGEYNRAQALLNTVTDGLERMKIASSMARPAVRIKSLPDIPFDPSEPRLGIYIPAVLIFSLLVGLVLSLLVEVIDTRVRTPADIGRQLGLPLLGSVPDLTEDERLALDTNLAMVGQNVPHSLMSEAFRQCRTNLLFASDHPIKSVLVTSPNPGDGKSTVASNLSITMARGGVRVILVEANFRRPTLAHAFDVPDTVGLSNVLVGLNKIEEAIQSTRVDNLDVLVCGALPPSPAELLGSASMRHLVQTLMQRYDQVVIDGAPMLVVADNYLLAEMVDGVVMVFCAGQNTRGMALRAARQVVSLRARLLGAVLNRVLATKGGYFRESFQAYYDYSGAACPTEPVASGVGGKEAADATKDS